MDFDISLAIHEATSDVSFRDAVLRKDLPRAISIVEQMDAAEKAEWLDDE